MQKFICSAFFAALLASASMAHAVASVVQEQALVPTSAYTQGLKLQTQARQGLGGMSGSDSSLSTVSRATPAATEEPGDNTVAMLLGALAIMAVVARRRWNSRD